MKDYYLEIEDYIDGKLSEDDLKDFKKELAKDKSLAKAIENFPVAKKIAGSFLEIELAKELEGLKIQKSKEVQPKPKVVPLWKRTSSIAASVILLAGLASSFFYANNNYSDKVLMANYLNEPIINSEMAAPNLKQLSYETAISLYDLNKFPECIAMFQELRSSDALKGEELENSFRMEAYSQFNLKNYEAASDLFDDLDGKDEQVALVLSLLFQGQKEKALEILNNNSSDKAFVELKSKIQSPWRMLTN